MVQLARSGSLRNATKLLKRTIGLGTIAGDSETRDQAEDAGSVSESSLGTGTFVSGLTEEQRDDFDIKTRGSDTMTSRSNTLGLGLKLPRSQSSPSQQHSLPPKPVPINLTRQSSKQKAKQLLPLQDQQQIQATGTHSASNSQQQKQEQEQIKHHHETNPNLDFEPMAPNLDSIPRLLLEEVLSTNAKVAEDAIDRLARRCRKSAEIREEAFRAGGHAIVIMVMRQWRDNEAIQAGGCRCITNMTCQFPDAKKSFAMIGGVESTLVAMKNYPNSLQVQGYGCGSLMNILCGHTDEGADSSMAMSRRFVNDLNGIAVVVEAMKQFPQDSKIQLGGCGLFQNLAQEKSFVYNMMQAGAVAAVGASLETHPGDPNIKKAAGSFMKKVFA
ncbi:armadillo repeat containing 6 [Seminavis robusta]|uniref:Armadillo repeat containing 6 n=1 Tax=Seminavis robusta TaxID=568900 RepID=A0A9N8DAA0_9STRA|nr:armadillo repeat containing 6 [Seminavis robusta]|eukprot:Sro13_g010260.1 armadillo repeat containing 6 (386) ;mRNA; f:166793-167950